MKITIVTVYAVRHDNHQPKSEYSDHTVHKLGRVPLKSIFDIHTKKVRAMERKLLKELHE